MDNNFCQLPFTSIFLGPDGGIKPCCSSRMNLGNLNEQSIDEILQGEIATSIRDSIIEGTWHKACGQCKEQEIRGVRSERLSGKNNFMLKHKSISKNYFKLERLDLRWSNICNLSCIYCYEYFSSKWAQLKGIKVNNLKDVNENGLFSLIELHKDSVETIMLLGGEPLLQKQNLDLVNILPDKNYYILTNLCVDLLNNPIAEKLMEKHITWGISFETIGPKFEFVRHGGKWEVFDKNIKYLQTRALEAHSLYSLYSAFNLDEFYDYILQNNFKEVHWGFLMYSGLNNRAEVSNLPHKLRELACSHLEYIIKNYSEAPGIADLTNYYNIMVNSLGANNPNNFQDELGKIQDYFSVSKIDKFLELWPNLSTLLKV
jgi:MoaA/NifB/PqqE/SkfB family radical SAM enzyme